MDLAFAAAMLIGFALLAAITFVVTDDPISRILGHQATAL